MMTYRSPCLALWNGYTLGDMRRWVMMHRRARAYAPEMPCRSGANEKPDPQRDVAMDPFPTGSEDGLIGDPPTALPTRCTVQDHKRG
jgi:hypothetical protein